MAFEKKEPGVFTIKAAKVGSASYGWDGTKFTFSQEGLENYAHTWAGGIITLNHMYIDHEESAILSSEFNKDDDMVYMDIKVANEETAARIENKEPTGVSIESNVTISNADHEIEVFTGTGVSIVFYPEQPACPLEEGCEIILSTKDSNHTGVKPDQKDNTLGKQSTTPMRVETILSGGINIADEIDGTPETTPTPETGVVSREDFKTVSTKLIEARQEIENLKSAGAAKEHTDQITAKDAEILELKAEIDNRDSEVAEKLVAKILEMDPEFEAQGKTLPELETIHSSLSRMIEKIKSEEEPESTEEPEDIAGANFSAPGGDKKDVLTIGGIQGGVWVGGNGIKPASAKVPLGSDE